MQISFYNSSNDEDLCATFLNLSDEYRAFSEIAKIDFHRRLDRLNFLVGEINRQGQRAEIWETQLKSGGRSVARTVVFLFLVWGLIWILNQLGNWSPHENSDLILVGILGFIWIGWQLIEKPRMASRIEQSSISIASMKNEWWQICGDRLLNSELVLLDEETHTPQSENEFELYSEMQQQLNIRTLESLVQKIGSIGGHGGDV